MTLIAGVKGDEFYITMNCGAQAEAKKQGVTLDFQGPDQFDATLQTPIVNGVVAKKPDAILIAPTDAKAMYVPIKQAADAGIKIVLVDTTLENSDLAVSQIASDNVGGGKAAAKALADAIGGNGQGPRQQHEARHLDHRRARQGLRGRGQDARVSTTSGRSTTRTSPTRPPRSPRASSPRTPTSRASSRRTCSGPRGPRPACASPATRR